MVKILVLNNYSLERVGREVRMGLKPAHHLHGCDQLERYGFEVEIVPLDESGENIFNRINSFLRKLHFPIPLGDLYQEFMVLRRGDLSNSIVYAPCQTQTQLLSYLKVLGLISVPMVVVAHHPPGRGRLARLRELVFRFELKGVNSYASLSSGVSGCINRLAGKNISQVLHWGPHLGYYERFRKHAVFPGNGFHCSGRTGRDFVTFARAALAGGVSAEVYCLENQSNKELLSVADGEYLKIHSFKEEKDFLYDKSVPIMARARAICIPLFDESSLAGLTSLTDAVGLGKPVIMTRNKYTSIDVEGEGIGFWVEPGDVAGWADRMVELQNNDLLCNKMANRVAEVAREWFNYDVYVNQVVKILQTVAGQYDIGRPKRAPESS